MIERPEFDGKQPVPVDELQALIGNSEKKCVIQLLAEPGERLYSHDFSSRFAGAQDPEGYVTYRAPNNLRDAVVGSHGLAGTYVSAADLSLTTWTATKAPDSEIADSLAGHNLALSTGYGLSLEEFWGKTSKSKAESLRGPQVRLRLSEALSAIEPGQTVSIPELAARLDLQPGLINSHIRRLYSFGFVEYDSTEVKSQATSFEIVGNPDPSQSTLSERGARVRSMPYYAGSLSVRTRMGQRLMRFQESGQTVFSYEELLAGDTDDPDSGIEMAGPYRSTLVGVLLREGVLKRRHKVTTNADQFSEISLTPEQKEIIDRAVRFYRGLRDNDPAVIKEGLWYGDEIMQNKKLVAELLDRAYNASPNVKAKSHEERAADVGLVLLRAAEGEGELSTRAIQQQLDEGSLTISSVGDILRKMRQGGSVTGHKKGNQMYWRLGSNQ